MTTIDKVTTMCMISIVLLVYVYVIFEAGGFDRDVISQGYEIPKPEVKDCSWYKDTNISYLPARCLNYFMYNN